MILMLTDASDVHADHVAQKLRERGADFVRFDPARFPSHAEVSIAYSAGGEMQFKLFVENQEVDLSGLRSVWYRRPGACLPPQEITDKPTSEYVEQECKVFMQDAWNSIDALWLPAPHFVIRRAELKASQLKVAGSLGFELPPTLFTNSAEEMLDFYVEHNGNIVSKLPSASLYRLRGTTINRYTQVVSKRDIGYARAVRLCPIILQAYVPKRVELRITVVGREVFAAEIHSQHSNHTRHDWRRYDRFKTPYFPHDLPPDLRQRCIQLVEQLGLRYGAIDMVLTPDERYVFLEINPNGQYLWIEEMTGLPISDAICDVLMAGNIERQSSPQPVASYAI